MELARKAQIDFYFDYRAPDNTQLDFFELVRDKLVVIARKGHPAIRKHLTKKQYLAARHIVYTHSRHHVGGIENMYGADQGITRDVVVEVQQVLAVPQLVMQSNGIATVPQRLARYFTANYGLDVHPFPFDVGEIPAYMIWHRSLNRDLGHQWMKQQISGGSGSI
ncbi:MAG: LysR substrate-binding domain-containing protein [Pseudomonadales bacterium]